VELDKLADRRIFDFVMTVPNVIDKEGERIPEEGLDESLDLWLLNGAPITMEHTNKLAAKGLRWWKGRYNGNDAYFGRGIVNEGPMGDVAWHGIKTKKYKMVSIGGVSLDPKKKEDGHTDLNDTFVVEVSLCEEGMHPDADIVGFNELAKAKGYKWFAKAAILDSTELEKKVVKRGDKWCVIHCHGAKAGQAIKCFNTKQEAEAMHAAIQANKADPHSEKFKRCVEHVKRQGSTRNAYAVCTAALGEEAFKADSYEKKLIKQLKGGAFMAKKVKKQEEEEEKPEEKPEEEKPEEEEKQEYVTPEQLAEALANLKDSIIAELRAPAEATAEIEETKKQENTDGGEPSPDGTEDEEPEGEASTPETDEGEGKGEDKDLSNLPDLNKKIEEAVQAEIKKALDFSERAETPRPGQGKPATEMDPYERMKAGIPTDFSEIRKSQRQVAEKQLQEIFG